jgi:hydrogenase expression/formation protein HypC
MCLGIPVKIISLDGTTGVSEFGGVKRAVDLRLLQEVRVGDWVVVHAGFAIQHLDESEAAETLRILEEMGCLGDA